MCSFRASAVQLHRRPPVPSLDFFLGKSPQCYRWNSIRIQLYVNDFDQTCLGTSNTSRVPTKWIWDVPTASKMYVYPILPPNPTSPHDLPSRSPDNATRADDISYAFALVSLALSNSSMPTSFVPYPLIISNLDLNLALGRFRHFDRLRGIRTIVVFVRRNPLDFERTLRFLSHVRLDHTSQIRPRLKGFGPRPISKSTLVQDRPSWLLISLSPRKLTLSEWAVTIPLSPGQFSSLRAQPTETRLPLI
ncbi:hypothetical protein C8R45DRAFT_1098963 [Mycena sanguinolenta]|nr:hypothetical protein C8R45DRAFT_1098963 [Mycena sanguinolenta]